MKMCELFCGCPKSQVKKEKAQEIKEGQGLGVCCFVRCGHLTIITYYVKSQRVRERIVQFLGEKKKKKKQRETYSAIVHKKSIFVPICHLCGVVGYIRPNCSLLRQKLKSETKFVVKNINVPKFVYVCHFCCYITYVNQVPTFAS